MFMVTWGNLTSWQDFFNGIVNPTAQAGIVVLPAGERGGEFLARFARVTTIMVSDRETGNSCSVLCEHPKRPESAFDGKREFLRKICLITIHCIMFFLK